MRLSYIVLAIILVNIIPLTLLPPATANNPVIRQTEPVATLGEAGGYAFNITNPQLYIDGGITKLRIGYAADGSPVYFFGGYTLDDATTEATDALIGSLAGVSLVRISTYYDLDSGSQGGSGYEYVSDVVTDIEIINQTDVAYTILGWDTGAIDAYGTPYAISEIDWFKYGSGGLSSYVSATVLGSGFTQSYIHSNTLGVGVTALAHDDDFLYGVGFYMNYTEAGNITEWPIWFALDRGDGQLKYFNYIQFPAGSIWERYAFRPAAAFVINDVLYVFGYTYHKTGYYSYDYLYDVFVLTINTTTLGYISLGFLGIAGNPVVPVFNTPLLGKYGVVVNGVAYKYGFYDQMTALGLVDEGRLLIAYYGGDNNYDIEAYVASINTNNWDPELDGWSTEWRTGIGESSPHAYYIADFATDLDYFRTPDNETHYIVSGALNYTATTGLEGFNAFYAVLNSTGGLEYVFVEGTNTTDVAYTVTVPVQYVIPAQGNMPVVPGAYSIITSNYTGADETTIKVLNVTEEYTSGTIKPTSLSGPAHKPVILQGFKEAGARQAKVPSSVRAGEPVIDGGVGVLQHLEDGFVAYFIDPAVPLIVDVDVTYEPESPALWPTTGYVLVNITANYTELYHDTPLINGNISLLVLTPSGASIEFVEWKLTNTSGYVEFQYNATEPGTYIFYLIYNGDAGKRGIIYRFELTLSNIRTSITLSHNLPDNQTYTLFEDPIVFTATVKKINLSASPPTEEPIKNETVYLLIYVDSSMEFWINNFLNTSRAIDSGYYYIMLVNRTDNNGQAKFVIKPDMRFLNNDTGLFTTLLYWFNHTYYFTVYYPGNDTALTPGNFSNIAEVDVWRTPIRLTIEGVSPGTIYAGQSFNVTVKAEYTHDDGATWSPAPNVSVTLYLYNYNISSRFGLGGLYYITNETGYVEITDITTSIAGIYGVEAYHPSDINFWEGSYVPGMSTFETYNTTDANGGRYVVNVTVKPAPAAIVVVKEPASTVSTVGSTGVYVKVINTITKEPVANAVIWVYVNGTLENYVYTNSSGIAAVDFPAGTYGIPSTGTIGVDGIPPAGTANLTLYFNGSTTDGVNIYHGQLSPVNTTVQWDVTLTKADTELYGTVYIRANVTQDYTIYVGVKIKDRDLYIENATVKLYFNNTYVTQNDTNTTYGVYRYAALSYTFTSPSNTNASLVFEGTAGLRKAEYNYTITARWFVRFAEFTVTTVNVSAGKVYLNFTARLERYNAGSWEPASGIPVTFYYTGSRVDLATRTTDPNGVAIAVASIPVGTGVTGLGAEASDPSIFTVNAQAPVPADVSPLLSPAPEPAIFPIILLASILLVIIIKKRR